MEVGYTKFGPDKAKHFLGGLIFALLGLVLLLLVQESGRLIPVALRPFFVAIPAFLAGIAKELYDALVKKGPFDLADLLFTVLGSLPVLLTWIICTLFYA